MVCGSIKTTYLYGWSCTLHPPNCHRNCDVSLRNQANKSYFHLFLLTKLFTESHGENFPCSCRDFALGEESYTHRCVLPPNPSFTLFSAGGRHVSEVSWHREIVYHSCPPPPPPLYLPIWNSSRSSALKYSQHFLPCFVHFSSCVSLSVSFSHCLFFFCPFYCQKYSILSSPDHFTL